eukprot:66779-Prymnesium_polylepis.2
MSLISPSSNHLGAWSVEQLQGHLAELETRWWPNTLIHRCPARVGPKTNFTPRLHTAESQVRAAPPSRPPAAPGRHASQPGRMSCPTSASYPTNTLWWPVSTLSGCTVPPSYNTTETRVLQGLLCERGRALQGAVLTHQACDAIVSNASLSVLMDVFETNCVLEASLADSQHTE